MNLGELKRKLDKLVRDGVSKLTPVSVDLNAFDYKRKLPSWTVLNADGIDLEAIDLCYKDGTPVIDKKGKVRKQFNIVVK